MDSAKYVIVQDHSPNIDNVAMSLYDIMYPTLGLNYYAQCKLQCISEKPP